MGTGTHRFTIGTMECISISDGSADGGKASVYFANAPQDEVAQALEAHGQQADALPQHFNILYIKTGDRQILVDTGSGDSGPPDVGLLMERLQGEGVNAGDIDTVIITHAHGDHIAGITDKDGDFNFPNASYIIWKDEWTHWTSEEMLSSNRGEVLRAKLLPVESKLTLIDNETEVAPGVCAIPAPGHTPGHMALLLDSGGERLLHIVDAAHQVIQCEHPDWSPSFDSLPDMSPGTRKGLFDRAAKENLTVMAYHFPFPGLGHVVEKGDAWEWQPL
jgi:glyoxylase-like metal-dependent hydrolase (beta-lactamase superfamily II)